MLKPFFTYYGGKYRTGLHYPKPLHPMIIEPFAGSAGYSLRYNERKIILTDVDPNIVCTWKYLIRVKPSEILRLPDLGNDDHLDDFILTQEQKLLIGWWLNKGTVSPCKRPGSWMRRVRSGEFECQNKTGRFFWGREVRERIASQVQRIRHWKAIQADYKWLPNRTATWFIDPPYNNSSGKYYRFSTINYNHLGEWCISRSGQAIVCEQEGAAWLPFSFFRKIKTSESSKGKSKSREVIYYSES